MSRHLAHSKICIVSPVYNEEEGITKFVEAVCETMTGSSVAQWELLLVNDGSQDGTLEILRKLTDEIPEVQFLNLSRNFGHQAALTAGLRHADADAVVLIDADLQDPPSIIPQLLEKWEKGNNIVFAQRTNRAETGVRRIGLDIFHRFFRSFINFPIPKNIGVFGLLDRESIEHLKAFGERNRFLPGLNAWLGGEQAFVEYERKGRSAGEPKQSLLSLFNYALDGIFSFSNRPIRLLSLAGLAVALGAFFLALFFTAKRLMGYESAFTGFTTLVILVALLGGLQLMALGLLGEYLGRIYDEVKGRPIFIVKEDSRES